MSVQSATKCVYAVVLLHVCFDSGLAIEEATDVTVSYAVQQMAAVRRSDDQQ